MVAIHISGPGCMSDEDSNRLIHAGAKAGKFRQCSLGWHEECSDPYGEDCRCECHHQEGR